MSDAMDVRVQRLQRERETARRIAREQLTRADRAEADRDRYRAVLEQIAAWRPDGVPIPNVQARTARAALNPPAADRAEAER